LGFENKKSNKKTGESGGKAYQNTKCEGKSKLLEIGGNAGRKTINQLRVCQGDQVGTKNDARRW